MIRLIRSSALVWTTPVYFSSTIALCRFTLIAVTCYRGPSNVATGVLRTINFGLLINPLRHDSWATRNCHLTTATLYANNWCKINNIVNVDSLACLVGNWANLTLAYIFFVCCATKREHGKLMGAKLASSHWAHPLRNPRYATGRPSLGTSEF